MPLTRFLSQHVYAGLLISFFHSWYMYYYHFPFQVSLTFAIRPESNTAPDFLPLYTSSEFDGSLQPHESKKIKLLYSPGLPNPYPSIGYFSVQARGGLGSCRVVCHGSAMPPKVRVEEGVVNFGNVELGKSATRSLCIRNESNCATTFQVREKKGDIRISKRYTSKLKGGVKMYCYF